jgi:hypothetical protein
MSLNYSDNLSNFDINTILNTLKIPFEDCLAKDEITTKNFTNGNYIINLQNHNQDGSHWTALIRNNENVFYVDSFGVCPPQNIVTICKQLKLQIFYNNTDIQNMNSNLCGYFCIALFIYLEKHKKQNMFDNIQDFTDMFNNKDSSKNDAILKRYINSFWKW